MECHKQVMERGSATLFRTDKASLTVVSPVFGIIPEERQGKMGTNPEEQKNYWKSWKYDVWDDGKGGIIVIWKWIMKYGLMIFKYKKVLMKMVDNCALYP